MSYNRFAPLQVEHHGREKRMPKKKQERTQSSPNQPTPAQRAQKQDQMKKQQQTQQTQKKKNPRTLPKPKNEDEKTFITVQYAKKKQQESEQPKLNKEEFVNERKKGNVKMFEEGQRRGNRQGGNDEGQGNRQGGQRRGNRQGGNDEFQGQGNRQGGQRRGNRQGGNDELTTRGEGYQGDQRGQQKPRVKHQKKHSRAPDSLNNPDQKRQGKTHHTQKKLPRENQKTELEPKPEDVNEENDQQENEEEKDTVHVDESESSEYFCEGVLVENKSDKKLEDKEIKKEGDDGKRKGYKSYLEEVESKKNELDKLLQEKLVIKKEENKAPSSPTVEVESISKKDKPLEVEDTRDSFFIKGNQNQNKEVKKKEKKQQGPKSVPISDYFVVRTKKHRGYNTVPEEKKSPQTPKQGSNTEKIEEGKSPSQSEGKKNTSENENKSPNYDKQGNPRNKPRNNQSRRNNRVDFESSQQFPPLSGEIVTELPKWGPGNH